MLTRTLTAERDRRSPRGMPNIGIGGQSAIFARAAAKQWNGHARASVGDLPRDGQRCRASPGCAGERTGCTHVGSSPIPIATGAEANCTYHVSAHLADFFSCVCAWPCFRFEGLLGARSCSCSAHRGQRGLGRSTSGTRGTTQFAFECMEPEAETVVGIRHRFALFP